MDEKIHVDGQHQAHAVEGLTGLDRLVEGVAIDRLDILDAAFDVNQAVLAQIACAMNPAVVQQGSLGLVGCMVLHCHTLESQGKQMPSKGGIQECRPGWHASHPKKG
ncbi:hypothetical protein D9M71_678590 [compost metagenome]